jgi:predicted  nucleic acid-binding Zn-ribbon protein
LELRNSVSKLDMENADLKKRIQKTEEKLSEIEKLIGEGLKSLD